MSVFQFVLRFQLLLFCPGFSSETSGSGCCCGFAFPDAAASLTASHIVASVPFQFTEQPRSSRGGGQDAGSRRSSHAARRSATGGSLLSEDLRQHSVVTLETHSKALAEKLGVRKNPASGRGEARGNDDGLVRDPEIRAPPTLAVSRSVIRARAPSLASQVTCVPCLCFDIVIRPRGRKNRVSGRRTRDPPSSCCASSANKDPPSLLWCPQRLDRSTARARAARYLGPSTCQPPRSDRPEGWCVGRWLAAPPACPWPLTLPWPPFCSPAAVQGDAYPAGPPAPPPTAGPSAAASGGQRRLYDSPSSGPNAPQMRVSQQGVQQGQMRPSLAGPDSAKTVSRLSISTGVVGPPSITPMSAQVALPNTN